MIDLDSTIEIRKADPGGVLASVQALPKQCEHAWQAANLVSIPNSYRRAVRQLVMTGMGGSLLAARLIESVFRTDLKIPLIKVNSYDLPGFVNENTLVIVSSYSGTTEESLENARQAIAKKAKWLAVCSGGELAQLANKAQVPIYKIDPLHNPSGQPRMAVGYSVIGQLALVSKLGLLSITDQNIHQLVETMTDMQNQINPENPSADNPAKQLAQKIYNKSVCLVAANPLAGAGHTIKNQFNESAKNFAARFDVPELNHHLMEGLGYPESNPQNLFFWLINSHLYSKKIQKRIQITEEVINKQGIETYLWQAKSSTPLAQAFELIQYGSYVVFYLSLLNGVNSNLIPWVDYFKEQLKK